jgi:transposase
MLTTLGGGRLPDWINEATAAGPPGIGTFAVGVHSDFDEMAAGLTTGWNSGPAEGHVNRIILWNRRCQAVCLCITSR